MTDLGHNSHPANAGGPIAAGSATRVALLVLRTSDFIRGQTTGSEVRERQEYQLLLRKESGHEL